MPAFGGRVSGHAGHTCTTPAVTAERDRDRRRCQGGGRLQGVSQGRAVPDDRAARAQQGRHAEVEARRQGGARGQRGRAGPRRQRDLRGRGRPRQGRGDVVAGGGGRAAAGAGRGVRRGAQDREGRRRLAGRDEEARHHRHGQDLGRHLGQRPLRAQGQRERAPAARGGLPAGRRHQLLWSPHRGCHRGGRHEPGQGGGAHRHRGHPDQQGQPAVRREGAGAAAQGRETPGDDAARGAELQGDG